MTDQDKKAFDGLDDFYSQQPDDRDDPLADFYSLEALGEDAQKAEEYNRWVDRFIRQLATFRTAEEQRRKLREKGCPEEYVRRLIELGVELGGIDDTWYVRAFIQSKSTWGCRRLIDVLRQKGVDRFVIDDVLYEEKVDDRDRALDVACLLLERGTDEKRALGKMLRLGYSWTVTRQAWAEALAQEEEKGE